jgi:phage shock protein PspC (stress-responsive transcriptional regulator)
MIKKSKSDRVFLGVCGGLAESTGIDARIVRLGFILGTIFTGSILFWIYLGLAILLPIEDER